MKGPNKAIKREYFRLPLIQEMKSKLSGAKVFTKLDLTSAFYHLELAKESRDLTTFLSECGMYRFTRLMFGVNCAPEVFQREMMRIFKEICNVIIYIDDILIYGESLEELHKTVSEVLRVLRANNLTLNEAKCEFDKVRVKFLGHELDENGFHIDEAKIKHINQFRQPKTSSELRSFLGLASFVSPYIQNFAELTSSLWKVATTKTWKWEAEQSAAFEATKSRIADCTLALGYFCESDRTVLYTDASPVALGAVLVQENSERTPRIISFASKALTPAERRYAQNQREALGAVWAVEYFSYYLLGRSFTLRTDAKGVAFILNRSREDSKRALTRADGWALRLSPYRITVEYVEGKFNIADPSSRLYEGLDDPFDESANPWEIAAIESSNAGFLTEDAIKIATAQDPTLTKVMRALETGDWPKQLRRFQAVGDDLHVKNGLLIKTGCVVMPESLRNQTLEVAHEGHPSSAKLKSILRARVWWPGMAKEAEDWAESCATCVTNGRPEKPTPMERIAIPSAVWDTVALDFNGPYLKFGGIYILLLVDYRSRYLIARGVKSTSFDCTKKVLDEIFDREGFPKNIKSDNGPPFNGEDYKRYCTDHGINAIFSTPLFPQQNGMVECYMKLVNKAMASAVANQTNYMVELQAAIKAHNSAQHAVTKVPPEEVMNGRKIRRGLPLLDSTVARNDELIEERDQRAKQMAKHREDNRRGARECRVMPGDTVVVERQNRAKGDSRFDPTRYTVHKQSNGNLVLSDEKGKLLKRHVSLTRKVKVWRDPKSGSRLPGPMPQEPTVQLQPSETLEEQADVQTRSKRATKVPAYLQDYVRLIEMEYGK